MDAWIISVLFIIIFLIIIGVFVVWYRARKNPPAPEEYYDEEMFEGYVEREFRCPNCSVKVEPDELICHECGSEFKEGEYECPQCGELVDPNELECTHCGYVFEMEPNVCPNCGHVVAADTTECPNCHEQFWSPLKLPSEEEGEKGVLKTLDDLEEGVEPEEGEEEETD